jgi:transposase
VLGIDDHRRGKPLYHRDSRTGAWVADADRWQTVFVDSVGGHGLLGQTEGRAGVDAVAWLAAQDPSWRAGISHVTIDMSTVYKSVVTTSGLLPNATLIVDAFHVIQLANTMIGDVRRRVTFEHYGRRGRGTDPEYTIKNLLARGQESCPRKPGTRCCLDGAVARRSVDHQVSLSHTSVSSRDESNCIGDSVT